MYTYTLVFIQIESYIVMLNRIKAPWMGMWNGLGGKIHQDETPLQAIQREIKEELNLDIDHHLIYDRGTLTWNDFDAFGQGIHLFFVKLDANELNFPIQMNEGIIDLKPIEWITDSNNYGVAPNIKYFLKPMMENKVEVHCIFESQQLIDVKVKKI